MYVTNHDYGEKLDLQCGHNYLHNRLFKKYLE